MILLYNDTISMNKIILNKKKNIQVIIHLFRYYIRIKN